MTIRRVKSADSGTYTLLVGNDLGTVTSNAVTLSIEYWVNVRTQGQGTVNVQRARYLEGSQVALTATPASGQFEFLNWSESIGAEDPTAPTITVTADRHRPIIAHFGPVVDGDWKDAYGIADQADDDDTDLDGFSNRQEFDLGTDPSVLDSGDIVALPKLIQLRKGWNLFSLPLQPESGTNISNLLGDNSRGGIWIWDAVNGEFIGDQQAAGKRGYWAHVPKSVEIEISGHEIVDSSLVLHVGWNLVGPTATAEYIDNALVEGPVWTWDADRKIYASLNGRELQECNGYWFHATGETRLQFP